MEYFYSKYTGEELEERLDRIDDIPELLAEMLTGKNYTTPEDALCIVKKYVPTIYENIPIDNNTIYWANTNDGKVLKARIKSSDNTGDGGDTGDTGDGGCLWEKKTDTNGKEYLYSKLPVVTSEGITMYADNGKVDVPSIYDGLPIDYETLFWVEDVDGNKVLKSKSGTIKKVSVSGDGNALSGVVLAEENTALHFSKSYTFATTGDLSRAKGELITEISKKADQTYVDETFVTFKKDEDIEGIKNFLNGIKINGHVIKQYDGYDDAIYVDANLVVRGGITMFGTNSVNVPTIMDAIATDNVNLKVVDGVLTFVGSSGGGLTEVYWDDVKGKPTLLSSFINDVGYIDQKDVYSLTPISNVNEVGIPAAGSFDYLTGMSADGALNDKRSFIGSVLNETTGKWYSVISVRHRNGTFDGNKYGMYISTRLDGNEHLTWDNQVNGLWKGERVILDSTNWSNYISVNGGDNFISTSGGRITNSTTGLYINRTTEGTNPHITFEVSGNRVGDFGVAAHGEPVFYSYGLTGSMGWKRILYDGASAFSLSNITIYQDKWANGIILKRQVASGGAGISSYNYDTLLGTFGVNGNKYFEFSNNLDSPVFTVSPNGDGIFYGGITMYSDIRKKTILNHVELTLQQIANAPLIEHYYNSDTQKTTHVGSIAQYWAGINDWFCKLDSEGYYTMEIQNAALASAISIARELVKYESKTDRKIRLLKQRVKELEDKIKQLENN